MKQHNNSTTRSYLASFFLFSALIVLLYAVIGFFPEDHTESELAIHHNGIFLTGPVTLFNNWNVYTFITYPVVFLKRLFPFLNIHGILLLFLSVVSLSNYFTIITASLREKGAGKKTLYAALFLLLPSVMTHEIFLIQYIKVALHLMGSGIILYNISRSRFLKAVGFLSFITGLLLRYEGFMIVFPLLISAWLLLKPNLNGSLIRHKIKINSVFIPVTIATILFCHNNFTKADKAYYPYHAIVNTIADFRFNLTDTAGKSKLDLARLKMIQGYYYNDVRHLNIENIKALGIQPVERNPFDLIHHFDLKYSLNRGIHDFFQFLKHNDKFILILLCCFALISSIARPSQIWRPIAYLLLSFVFIFCMSVYMDIQDRFGIPVLTLAFLLNLGFCLQYYPKNTDKAKSIIFAVMLLSVLLHSYNISFKIKQYLDTEAQSKHIAKALNGIHAEVVFWDFYLFPLLDNKIASNYPLYDKDRDYSIDFPFGFALEEYKARMQQRFGSDKLTDIIDQSVNNKKMVYFSASETLMTHINYINLQYNRHIRILKIDETPVYINTVLNPAVDYYLFYLSED